MFRGAISEIILNDSFMVETTQARSYLVMARKLITLLSEETAEQKEFAKWLHTKLCNIVCVGQSNNQVNEDTLWKNFFIFQSSEECNIE